MLFLLRQLRRSFFLPGKFRTYLAYAFGEILLIVVGILIAVQIGEWNQSRRDFAEETSILHKLKSDFEQNQGRLKQNREMYGAMSEDLRAFLEVIGPDPEVVPDELVHRYMSSLYVIPGYQPNTGTINSLIGSGTISLIANEALNYNLNSWPAAIEAYHYELAIMADLSMHDETFYPGYHHFRDLKVSIAGFLPEEFRDGIELANTGPSKFAYDQKALLSMPRLESSVELKRVEVDAIRYRINFLLKLQQEILDLIEEELGSR